MPFVERNWRGEITGLFARLQPDCATETLPEDDPEVVAFKAKHPVPENFLKPLTEKESQRMAQSHKRLENEHQALRNAIWAFNAAFNELEIALSALLHEMLHIPGGQVAYAIYYSPNGFSARTEIVANVIQQMTMENQRLKDLLPLWSALYKDFRGTRETRNAIAHGMPITLAIRGKNHARLTSPPFDANRVGRHIHQGRVPGLTASDITNGVKKTQWLTKRIDDVNRLFAAFHDDENPTLPEKYHALKTGLRTKDNR